MGILEKVPISPDLLVATIATAEYEGGLVAYHGNRRIRLKFRRYAMVGPVPCGIYYDPLNDLFPVITACAGTGQLYAIGHCTHEDMAHAYRKRGVFLDMSKAFPDEDGSLPDAA